ncbi:MAG: glycoside hydrolase superfamily, partial [Olpidium bornovanus]
KKKKKKKAAKPQNARDCRGSVWVETRSAPPRSRLPAADPSSSIRFCALRPAPPVAAAARAPPPPPIFPSACCVVIAGPSLPPPRKLPSGTVAAETGARWTARKVDRLFPNFPPPFATVGQNGSKRVAGVDAPAAVRNAETDEGTGVVRIDPWLEPFRGAIRHRYSMYKEWLDRINKNDAGYDKFTRAYEHFGLHSTPNGIVYREWAPGATSASLIGEFNNWDWNAHPMKRDQYGVWEVAVPNSSDGSPAIPHNSKIKISMTSPTGERFDRLPAWSRYVVQDLNVSPIYDAVFWNPPEKYKWKNKSPPKPNNLKIYEAHVGISSPEGRVATYNEFTDNVLRRIAYLGYNAIQLMAIMEHAYYASFGYQVTSFFAPSSRYGTPEDLKRLIDTAHEMGLTILLDVVHSHACKNVLDGLNMFDGTDHCYFHGGGRGHHDLWDRYRFCHVHGLLCVQPMPPRCFLPLFS